MALLTVIECPEDTGDGYWISSQPERSDKGKCDFFIIITLNYGESDGNNIFYLCDAKG